MKKKLCISAVLVLCGFYAIGAELTGNMIVNVSGLRKRIAPVKEGLESWQMRCMILKDGEFEFRKREYETAGNLLDLVEGCEESCDGLWTAMRLTDLVEEGVKRDEALRILKMVVEQKYYKTCTDEYYLFESRDIPAAGVYVKACRDVLREMCKVCAAVGTAYGIEADLAGVEQQVKRSFGAK